MGESEKRVIERIAEAMNVLPEGKKEFLLGYAEGVAAMAQKPLEGEDDQDGQAGEEHEKGWQRWNL